MTDLLVEPIAMENSTVNGYLRAKWIEKWWETAKWSEAGPTLPGKLGGSSGLNGDVGCVHVECGEPEMDGAIYRVRSRAEKLGTYKGYIVIDVHSARAPGIGVGWVWVYEVVRKAKRRG